MSRELVLSKRMQSVADRISDGLVLADVGCDHGYLSIWLCQTGKIPAAIAMDVNKGPLERAAQNVALYGLKDRIQLRLSDGLMKLKAGEVESIAIAGMGGMLTIRILSARPDILSEVKELVLEPQSDVEGVRRFLGECGFVIVDEDMVLEDGKFYPVIRAVHREAVGSSIGTSGSCGTNSSIGASGSCGANSSIGASGSCGVNGTDSIKLVDASDALNAAMDETIALRFGRILLEKKHPVLKEFLERNLVQTEELRQRLEANPTGKGLARAEELKKEAECMKAALGYYK
ncbi:MAG: class I SAM-dependent methyltransferase [Lachnospiraceae bacterium]|nr:class I SAM-dependent methyltransferase [Lachnospiraceae bacterium]